MTGYDVTARASNISGAGKGLFATKHFDRNEEVVGMDGDVIRDVSDKELAVLPDDSYIYLQAQCRMVSDYGMNGRNCDEQGVPLWYFMNHSRDSKNVECRWLEEENRVAWFALRNIKTGREILFNYSPDACMLYDQY